MHKQIAAGLPDVQEPTMRYDHDDTFALRQFDRLLATRSSEADFQRLFARYPRILSLSLPLQQQPSNIMPLGRPGRSEPDFLIAPDERGSFGYGVIELKRPDQKIFSVRARKGLIVLSRTAAVAVAQVQHYLDPTLIGRESSGSNNQHLADPKGTLIVGNSKHAFIIMGMSEELTQVTGTDLLRQQVDGLLPANCQIIPYDALYAWFRAHTPPQLLVLVPANELYGRSTIPQLDDVLYDPSYWEVSHRAIDYWSEVSEQVRTIGASEVPDLTKERWTVQSGPAAGSLDRVPEANEDLILTVVNLLYLLNRALADDQRRPSLESFLQGFDLIFRSGGHRNDDGPKMSRRQEAVLATAMSYSETRGRLIAPLDPTDRNVVDLRRSGILRLEQSEDEQTYYALHPILRWFGPIRWAVPVGLGSEEDGPTTPGGSTELRGSHSGSTLDDDHLTATFGFDSVLLAQQCRAWIRDSYGNLLIRNDNTVRTVSILNYNEVDQFDRLAIRQVATREYFGDRIE